MKLSTNSIAQVLALALQALNQLSTVVPLKAQFWVMLGISALQGVSAIVAHLSNPDGTKPAPTV